ncbi:MAG: hypothetical protein GSR82_01400 [Desulfurococcales archaeon]|nr:hypothetical protein [Desulfurococcales archaeon]
MCDSLKRLFMLKSITNDYILRHVTGKSFSSRKVTRKSLIIMRIPPIVVMLLFMLAIYFNTISVINLFKSNPESVPAVQAIENYAFRDELLTALHIIGTFYDLLFAIAIFIIERAASKTSLTEIARIPNPFWIIRRITKPECSSKNDSSISTKMSLLKKLFNTKYQPLSDLFLYQMIAMVLYIIFIALIVTGDIPVDSGILIMGSIVIATPILSVAVILVTNPVLFIDDELDRFSNFLETKRMYRARYTVRPGGEGKFKNKLKCVIKGLVDNVKTPYFKRASIVVVSSSIVTAYAIGKAIHLENGKWITESFLAILGLSVLAYISSVYISSIIADSLRKPRITALITLLSILAFLFSYTASLLILYIKPYGHVSLTEIINNVNRVDLAFTILVQLLLSVVIASTIVAIGFKTDPQLWFSEINRLSVFLGNSVENIINSLPMIKGEEEARSLKVIATFLNLQYYIYGLETVSSQSNLQFNSFISDDTILKLLRDIDNKIREEGFSSIYLSILASLILILKHKIDTLYPFTPECAMSLRNNVHSVPKLETILESLNLTYNLTRNIEVNYLKYVEDDIAEKFRSISSLLESERELIDMYKNQV